MPIEKNLGEGAPKNLWCSGCARGHDAPVTRQSSALCCSLPHKLLQDFLHPHVASQGVQSITPEELQKSPDIPAALLKDKFLPIVNAKESISTLRNRKPCGFKDRAGNLRGRTTQCPKLLRSSLQSLALKNDTNWPLFVLRWRGKEKENQDASLGITGTNANCTSFQNNYVKAWNDVKEGMLRWEKLKFSKVGGNFCDKNDCFA